MAAVKFLSRTRPVLRRECDDWERSGGVYLMAQPQREIMQKRRKLPAEPRAIDARVPVVGYRGAYRVGIASDPDVAIKAPFQIRCQNFRSGILGVELRQPPEQPTRLLGRPILGFCAKDVVSGYYGDPYSRETDLTSIRAYIDANGAALMAAETTAGATKVLDHVQPNEVFAFTSICLSVYIAKCNATATAGPISV